MIKVYTISDFQIFFLLKKQEKTKNEEINYYHVNNCKLQINFCDKKKKLVYIKKPTFVIDQSE